MGTITLLNSTKYRRQPVPEVGKEYHIFNDGKIRPSRHGITTVAEVIPFRDCWDFKLLEAWNFERRECYWLYAEKTDYFVRTTFTNDPDAWFVRTTDGGWFSLGYPDWWSGARLDIDGSLYANMLKCFKEDNWYGI